jgi:hypothetical protein
LHTILKLTAMELLNFEKYGHLLKNPFVLIGFLALILLLIIKYSKIYDATDIAMGFLVLYPTKKFRIFIKSKKRVILYVLPDKTLFSA